MNIKKYTLSALSIGLAINLTGCASEAMQVASSLGSTGLNAVASNLTGKNTSIPNIATSAQTQKGYIDGLKTANSLATNPAALAVSSLSLANSKQNEEANKAAFSKVQAMMNNPQTSTDMQNRLVQVYNQQHGTAYKTYEELQDAVKSGEAQ